MNDAGYTAETIQRTLISFCGEAMPKDWLMFDVSIYWGEAVVSLNTTRQEQMVCGCRIVRSLNARLGFKIDLLIDDPYMSSCNSAEKNLTSTGSVLHDSV